MVVAVPLSQCPTNTTDYVSIFIIHFSPPPPRNAKHVQHTVFASCLKKRAALVNKFTLHYAVRK